MKMSVKYCVAKSRRKEIHNNELTATYYKRNDIDDDSLKKGHHVGLG
jgi:hypothetical protein